ncbi:MAG: hypothetical protein WCX74_01670 [Candidatus Paceibacterota bacterium]
MNIYKKNGFATIEAMLAVSILVLFFLAFAGAIIFNRQNQESLSNRGTAITLSEEAIEAVRNVRDAGFEKLSDGDYGLSEEDGKWKLISGFEIIDRFTRKVTITSIDNRRKKVVSKVSWQEYGNAKDVILTTYLTNWK